MNDGTRQYGYLWGAFCPQCGHPLHAVASAPPKGAHREWYFLGPIEARQLICFGGTFAHFIDRTRHKMIYQKDETAVHPDMEQLRAQTLVTQDALGAEFMEWVRAEGGEEE